MGNVKYCPHCQQNVGVITKPTTTSFVLCGIGLPFLAGANTSSRKNTANLGLAITSLVTFIVLFKILIIIGWIIALVSFFFRRSFCPICRTPGSMLLPRR